MALSAAALSEIEEWVALYAAQTANINDRTTASVWAAFEAVTDWNDPAQTIAAALLAMEIAQANRQTTGGLSAQYAAVVMAIITGRPQGQVSPDLVRLLVNRKGVKPFDVWSRPVFLYREILRRGGTPAEAFAAARLRAEILTGIDLSLAKNSGVLAQLGIEGALKYRRVIRPELSETGTCGLCIAASDQVYNIGTLMPLHARCKCIVLPIIGDVDPGMRLNEGDLGQLYEDAGSTNSRALKKIRYTVEQHSELGPILTPRNPALRDPIEALAA